MSRFFQIWSLKNYFPAHYFGTCVMTLLVPILKRRKKTLSKLVGNLFQPCLEITAPYRLGMAPWSRMGGSTITKLFKIWCEFDVKKHVRKQYKNPVGRVIPEATVKAECNRSVPWFTRVSIPSSVSLHLLATVTCHADCIEKLPLKAFFFFFCLNFTRLRRSFACIVPAQLKSVEDICPRNCCGRFQSPDHFNSHTTEVRAWRSNLTYLQRVSVTRNCKWLWIRTIWLFR